MVESKVATDFGEIGLTAVIGFGVVSVVGSLLLVSVFMSVLGSVGVG